MAFFSNSAGRTDALLQQLFCGTSAAYLVASSRKRFACCFSPPSAMCFTLWCRCVPASGSKPARSFPRSWRHHMLVARLLFRACWWPVGCVALCDTFLFFVDTSLLVARTAFIIIVKKITLLFFSAPDSAPQLTTPVPAVHH